MSAKSRENENARADNRADPERRQLKRPQCALQAVFARFGRLFQQPVHRFLREQWVPHALPPKGLLSFPDTTPFNSRPVVSSLPGSTANTPALPAIRSIIPAKSFRSCPESEPP